MMLKFAMGVILGIVVCTVGFAGIARIFDHGVAEVQSVARDAAK
jgi:flagellar biosynthesis protein FliR